MPSEAKTNQEPPGTSDRWLVLSLVALNYFVLYLHRNVLNYVQPPLIADLHLTDMQLGFLRQGFLLPYCMAQLVVGYLGDRFSRRSVILCSLLASSVALAGMGFADSFEAMLALRILLGVGQSAAVPAMASALADCFTQRSRSTAIGIYLASYNFALVFAGRLGGQVADVNVWHLSLGATSGWQTEVAGWRMAHFLFAGVGLTAGLILWFGLREPARTERTVVPGAGARAAPLWTTVFSVLGIPTFLIIAAVFLLSGMVVSSMQFWLPRYFHEQFQMTLKDAGSFATFFIQPATIAGLLFGGTLGDRCGRKWIQGRTAVQTIGLVALVPVLVVIGLSQDRTLLAVAMVVYGLGVGLYQSNLWTTTFEVVDPAARATAVGLLNLVSGLFGSWIDPIIGKTYPLLGGLGNVLAGLSLPVGLSVLLLLFSMKVLLPRDHRERSLAAAPE